MITPGPQFNFINAEDNTSGYHRMEANLEGKQVGKLDFDPETGRINHVHVDPEHRRKGIATELLKQASNYAYREGYATPEHGPKKDMTEDGLAWSKSVR